MSFEKIENYLNKSEAIKNYDKVVNENNRIRRTSDQQAKDLNRYRKRVNELEQIRITYTEKEYSPEAFQRLVEDSAEKWKQNIRENEVNEKWLNSKDGLISETIDGYFSDYPKSCPPIIRRRVSEYGRQVSDTILMNPSAWPEWFKTIQETDADKQTLKLMDKKFDEKVENKAQERLSQLEREKWPEYVRDKTVPFFQKNLSDQLMTLSKKISIRCPRCSESYVVNLTMEEMRELISKGKTESKCGNDKCRNIFGRKSISISFEEVLIQKELSQYIERLIGTPIRRTSIDDVEENDSENNSK